MRWPRRGCCDAAGYTRAHARPSDGGALLLRPHLPERRHGREAPRPRRGELIDALRAVCPARASPIVGLEPLPADPARRSAGHGSGRERAGSSRRRRCCSRSSSRARARRGASRSRFRPRGAPILRARPLPSEGVRRGEPDLEVLRLIPDAKPRLIESSCCGMAGSFGYEAEHYEISMQMAELTSAAGRAQRARRHRRRRRHQLPPPDRARRAAGRRACGTAARSADRLGFCRSHRTGSRGGFSQRLDHRGDGALVERRHEVQRRSRRRSPRTP